MNIEEMGRSLTMGRIFAFENCGEYSRYRMHIFALKGGGGGECVGGGYRNFTTYDVRKNQMQDRH